MRLDRCSGSSIPPKSTHSSLSDSSMRFLNTSTGEFVWISDPSSVRYAILSHTWRTDLEGGEQSFEDVQALQADKPSPTLLRRLSNTPIESHSILAHPALSEKIKGICKIARLAGYKFVWIDSCCINKSSSAELSEAINSMYEWYKLADVCYVYLADVSDDPGPAYQNPQFRNTKWCKRGWTLQELIAPKRVVFLFRTWAFLGTKMGLALTLEVLTGIDYAILTGTAPLESVSVARRLSWAAKRETTRIEDEAYCLMGLFGVHMATIYGEGRNAFLRLQEEIIKIIPDQSIFAWGRTCTVVYDEFREEPRILPSAVPAQQSEISRHGWGLLARSPQDFEHAGDITPFRHDDLESLMGVMRMEGNFRLPSLHSLFTPQGVRLRVPLLDVSTELPHLSSAFAQRHAGSNFCNPGSAFHSLALLLCQDGQGAFIGLILSDPPQNISVYAQEPLIVASHTECHALEHIPFRPRTLRLRVLTLMSAMARRWFPQPREVYIRRHHIHVFRSGGDPSSTIWPYSHPGFGSAVSFSIAPECVQELRILGFAASSPLEYSYASDANFQDVAVKAILSRVPAGGGSQGVVVRVSLTNSLVNSVNPSQWISTAEFTVEHPVGVRTGVTVWADKSGGRRTPRVQRLSSDALLTETEFTLHARAIGWEDTGPGYTTILRVAVRGTSQPTGYDFSLALELSQPHNPQPERLSTPGTLRPLR
ncbi:heterokaryon incompatibility protein-domain-containing protein [Lenzites betulinus]|nr:heterokaryon incompatibility protein-domain-containing protein [Lenzites betulinus]